MLEAFRLQKVICGTGPRACSLFDDDNLGPSHLELTGGTAQSRPRPQSVYNIIEVAEVVGEDTEDVYKKTSKTSMYNVIQSMVLWQLPADGKG